jgi:Ni,Fe-hydrogenase III small subunit
MIVDIIERSLREHSPLIPVEALFNTCEGSRMPDIRSAWLLTPAIARRVQESCPTRAFTVRDEPGHLELKLSYGECIGCGRCIEVGQGSVVLARGFAWTGVQKEGLVRRWDVNRRIEIAALRPLPEDTHKQIHSMLGRALNIRQLDPGSCNGCEAEITALSNPYYDLERFGIHFVASPKHADLLLVTGPVTRNMADAAKATYEAMPAPKFVVAVGACGCSGGIFANSHAVVGAVDAVLPVDGYIPGCPPTPAMLVTGILNVLRRRLESRPNSLR